MKKGFTLIEVTAVITLLGVVFLIITPNVIKTFNNSKNKMIKLTAERLIDATNVYLKNYELNHGVIINNITIFIRDKKIQNDVITINGDLPEYGDIFVDEYCNIVLAIYMDGKCAIKERTSSEVKINDSDLESCNILSLLNPEE